MNDNKLYNKSQKNGNEKLILPESMVYFRSGYKAAKIRPDAAQSRKQKSSADRKEKLKTRADPG